MMLNHGPGQEGRYRIEIISYPKGNWLLSNHVALS